MRILVVDDEPAILAAVRVVLEAAAQQLGASAVLHKPFTGKQLLAVIQQVLK